MARFWKSGTDRSIEGLLRANRATPHDDFASSVLRRVQETPPPRRRISPRRFRLALATAVALVAVAAALGGITAASAGVGGIVHAAAQIVTPSHANANASGHGTASHGPAPAHASGDHGSSADDQYHVGTCHREGNGTFHLIFVDPSALPAHLGHGDHLPVDGHC